MRIYFKVVCKYMSEDGRTVNTIPPGVYEVPRQVSERAAKIALTMGRCTIVPDAKKAVPKPKVVKKAPENKVLKAKESK